MFMVLMDQMHPFVDGIDLLLVCASGKWKAWYEKKNLKAELAPLISDGKIKGHHP